MLLLKNKKAASRDAAFLTLLQALRFPLANLSLVDRRVYMLDRLVAMAMELALGVRHMLPRVSQGLDRLIARAGVVASVPEPLPRDWPEPPPLQAPPPSVQLPPP